MRSHNRHIPSESDQSGRTTAASSPNTGSARRVAIAGVFAALGLIFSYIESLFPAAIGIPGIKLGLANLVVIIALYKLSARYAISINVIRVLMAGALFTGMFGALYSLAGCLLSFTVMLLCKKAKCFSVIGVSMAGGVAHNLGQLAIAAVLVSSGKIFYYLPVLILSGTISGILIGIVAYVVMKRLPALAG